MLKDPRKYEKTYRIDVPWFDIPGKNFLTNDQVKRLLSGNVTVSEKLDGANTAVTYIHGSDLQLQKRGSWVDNSHLQYKFFQQIMKMNETLMKFYIPDNTVVYMELMYCRHTVEYDRLTDYTYILDAFDLDKEKYWGYGALNNLSDRLATPMAPVIYQGKVTVEELRNMIPDKSSFGGICEGIVIHNENRDMRAKIVKPEFIKSIEGSGHWSKRNPVINKLLPIANHTARTRKWVTFTGY